MQKILEKKKIAISPPPPPRRTGCAFYIFMALSANIINRPNIPYQSTWITLAYEGCLLHKGLNETNITNRGYPSGAPHDISWGGKYTSYERFDILDFGYVKNMFSYLRLALLDFWRKKMIIMQFQVMASNSHLLVNYTYSSRPLKSILMNEHFLKGIFFLNRGSSFIPDSVSRLTLCPDSEKLKFKSYFIRLITP